MQTKSIREEKVAIANQIIDDIQNQVLGVVECREDVWLDRYELQIRTVNFVFCFDITDMIYEIIKCKDSIIPMEYKEIIDTIISEYKKYVYLKYFKEAVG